MAALRRAWGLFRSLLPGWWDLHVYGGIGAVSYGVWSIWPPAGYVVFGAMIGGLGLWFHARGSA